MWDVRYARRALRMETLAESVTAATLAAAVSGEEPTVLLYNPPARGNPYQQLLYSRALDHGVCAVPLHSLDELEGLRWPYRTVVHIHWTSPIIQSQDDAASAEQAADEAIELLERARSRGITLVWTVHNVLPHECRYVEPEERLRQWLADHASMVHILSETTTRLVAPHYRLEDDGRLVRIPIPNYVGVYPDHVQQPEARYELGIPGDAKVAVLVGAIRSYKGVDVLAEALDHLDDDWIMLVAGKPIDDDSARHVEALADARPNLSIWPRHIAIEEMQLFFRSADVAVLPYVDGLNSAALSTVLSFGLPVVAADSGAFAEVVTDDVGRVVPAGDAQALAEALVAVYDRRETYGPGIAANTEACAPATVSNRFFEGLLARLR